MVETRTLEEEAACGLLYLNLGDVTAETFVPFRMEVETIEKSSCSEIGEEFRTRNGWLSY